MDDLLTLIALAFDWAASITTSVAVYQGLGQHAADLNPSQRTKAIYHTTVSNAVTALSFVVPKMAIVALLQRIFPIRKATLIIFWVSCGISVGSAIVLAIFWFQQCHPIAHQWDPNIPGSCWSISVIENWGYFTASFSAALDLLFALYPQPIIARLNISLDKRIAFCLALSLSGVGCVASIYKMSKFKEIVDRLKDDPTFAVVPLALWTIIETNVLIICASLPTLGSLVRFLKARHGVYLQQKNRDTMQSFAKKDHADEGNRYSARAEHFRRLSSREEIPLVHMLLGKQAVRDPSPSQNVRSTHQSEQQASPDQDGDNSKSHQILKTVEIEQTYERNGRPLSQADLGLAPGIKE